jgi:hypothetical protein
MRPYLKINPSQKMAGEVAQCVYPELKLGGWGEVEKEKKKK